MSGSLAGLTGATLLTVVEIVLIVVALVVAPRGRRPSFALTRLTSAVQ